MRDMLTQIHAGEADILVGTQMLAKGHDFPNLTLVGVINADGALYSSDFRAGEKLFAQLMQVSGRAGRADLAGEVLVQTEIPDHPLYGALMRHDFTGYADALLKERKSAGFPPYVYQTLLRFESVKANAVEDFAQLAVKLARDLRAAHPGITVYDAFPRQSRASRARSACMCWRKACHDPSCKNFPTHGTQQSANTIRKMYAGLSMLITGYIAIIRTFAL